MITDCFTGLVRAVGMLLFVILSSEFIYFLLFSESPEEAKEKYLFNPARLNRLFSEASYSAKGNSVCNPYRFKKPKLIAKAMSFIFFTYPGDYRFAICAGKNQSANSGNRFSSSGNYYSSIHPGKHHSYTWRRNDVTRKLFAYKTLQNPTTCL